MDSELSSGIRNGPYKAYPDKAVDQLEEADACLRLDCQACTQELLPTNAAGSEGC